MMDAAEFAKKLDVKSPMMFIHGTRHPDQDDQSDYCIYDPKKFRFFIFMHGDDTFWQLHGIGQVKSHELGFPLLSRIFSSKERKEESQLYDGSNKALQNVFQHPHEYKIIEPLMGPDGWSKTFDRLLTNFERGAQFYGSSKYHPGNYMAAFAVAHMGMQVAEVLLSSERYSKSQVARTKECMKAIDGLADNGISLPDDFWESSASILRPYYDRGLDGYTDGMEGDFIRMANLMLPEFIKMNIYTGPTNFTAGKITTSPGVDIPNWLIDYQYVR